MISKNLKTMRSFGREIYNGITTLNDGFEEKMLEKINKCIYCTRPKS